MLPMFKILIERGEELAKKKYLDVDYADLLSKTLVNFCKESIINNNNIK